MILYGRAALQLGFDAPPSDIAESQDVDAIIPLSDVPELSNDDQFWEAQEATNRELRSRGLYITHLFKVDQVFLRKDWEQQVAPITRLKTRWLRLFRPSTLDLILTKMMRGEDPQDMADIEFLIRHDQIDVSQIKSAFAEAVIPNLSELRESFEFAKPRVLALAATLG